MNRKGLGRKRSWSDCHDTVLCRSSFEPGTSRIEVASVTDSLTCSVVDKWCHLLPSCRLCLPLLLHRARFNPLRLSCIWWQPGGCHSVSMQVTEDRTAASSPVSHRAPLGTELVSYLVAVFTEWRVATDSFVKLAPLSVRPSVRVEQICCRWTIGREIWQWALLLGALYTLS